MENLNSNSSKILSYINASTTNPDTGEDISHYPSGPREHNERRIACIGKLKEVVKHVLNVTTPSKSAYTFNKIFINFSKKPTQISDPYSKVRQECRNILVYLTCIVNPEQKPTCRAVAAHECVHSLDYIREHALLETDILYPQEFTDHLTVLFSELTGCLEQPPGHLLIPGRELHLYSSVFPTGVYASRLSNAEFMRGYDLDRTCAEKISKWRADLIRCANLLNSTGDPYRWLSWSFVVSKGDEFKGTWAGCAIVETLKKVCGPEHVANGIAGSRSALEYVSATKQGRSILKPLESSIVTRGMAISLCESRIEPKLSRWPAYRQQGARNFNILADFIDTTNLAKQLPVEFVYSSRMCRIATSTVNSVSNYITDQVAPDNEIVLETLLAEGWSGTVESLVNAVNSL